VGVRFGRESANVHIQTSAATFGTVPLVAGALLGSNYYKLDNADQLKESKLRAADGILWDDLHLATMPPGGRNQEVAGCGVLQNNPMQVPGRSRACGVRSNIYHQCEFVGAIRATEYHAVRFSSHQTSCKVCQLQ
jgi:hypothetical protein